MWIWGPVIMIALVAAIVWAVRAGTSPRPPTGGYGTDPTHSARRILAERYARCEIDTEEYHERLEHLR